MEVLKFIFNSIKAYITLIMHLVVQFICLYPKNLFKIYSTNRLMCFARFKMKKK